MSQARTFEALGQLLAAKLKPITEGRTLNLVVCVEVYTTIFDTLIDVVTSTDDEDAQLGNEAMNYLAQQFYDGILVNGTQELDPDIFTQRAKLPDVPTKELVALSAMLAGSDFAVSVLEEIRRRS